MVANAKRMLSVLQLGAPQGASLSLTAEGDDAVEAVEALAELVENRLGEAE
jgi:phosphotransferase system HPr (HPr) family protein